MSAAGYVSTPEGHRIVKGEKEYIPSDYVDHVDLSLQVTLEGEPLGFTVGEMMPTRRWAVDNEGRVMGGFEFEATYKRWHQNLVAPNGQIISITAANKYSDANLEPVPTARDFVSKTRDAQGSLVDIVGGAAPAAAPLVEVATAQGEIGGESTEKVPAGYKVKGESPTEKTLREEVERLKAEAAAREAEAPPPAFAAPCGFEAKSKAGAAAHKRNCEKCAEETGE